MSALDIFDQPEQYRIAESTAPLRKISGLGLAKGERRLAAIEQHRHQDLAIPPLGGLGNYPI